ncbi:superinfection immunity protein [Pseudomonas guariconensis]|uniref:superinfection immunity protein n=1 Tax=Pseudomonas guariconensis TaxID=1288410 RepID=UPI002B05F1E9|nr:superinfection immunity protein [Pseudomonas guariconensis]
MELLQGLYFGYLVVYLAIYILPMIIAFHRHHEKYTTIFLLNLLLGWTVVGWVVALVWAVIGKRRVPSVDTLSVDVEPDRYVMLEKITALRNSGSLSEEEFQREKSRILG